MNIKYPLIAIKYCWNCKRYKVVEVVPVREPQSGYCALCYQLMDNVKIIEPAKWLEKALNNDYLEELKVHTGKNTNRAAALYLHMAEWYATNDPGTPVPDWCFLAWPIDEQEVDKLIETYEKETGKSVLEP